jgi:hypothetical protein
MTEHTIEIPCNTEVVIRVSCKELALEPILVTDPLPPIPVANPTIESIPLPVVPAVSPERCYCDLDSPLSLAEFVKQLTTLTKGLLYPSESDFPIEVLAKGFITKMPSLKGTEVRKLDRVIPIFLRSENTRWQALYDFIKQHASVTAWHYPVKSKPYTHEEVVIMLHPQGTVGLKLKLVET